MFSKKLFQSVLAVVAIVMGAISISGCQTTPKEVTVIKREYVPVTLSDDHYVFPAMPAPPSRDEVKGMTARQYIDVQDDYVAKLQEHSGILEQVIVSVKTAAKEMAAKLKKEPTK